jgi:hypothetical protein
LIVLNQEKQVADELRAIQRPIVIFANGVNPLNPDLRDGYLQRVSQIDRYLSHNNRVYIKVTDRMIRYLSLRKLGDRCFELEIYVSRIRSYSRILRNLITRAHHVMPYLPLRKFEDRCFDPEIYPSGIRSYSELVRDLIERAQGIYCHSIYPLFYDSTRQMIKWSKAPFIIDVHGVVPEERGLMGHHDQAKMFQKLESWAFTRADALVHVSRQMQRHFEMKYSEKKAYDIVCPIFLTSLINEVEKPHNQGNAVVYAGGAQAWQQAEKMVQHIAKAVGKYDFIILSPEPKVFIKLFAKYGISPDGSLLNVTSASPSEVRSIYRKSRYGIILREHNIVNRVACPTKLVEYISYGLLPILDTQHIGDFADLGLQYAALSEMSAGRLPSGETLARQISQNKCVARELEAMSKDGLTKIGDIFQVLTDRDNQDGTSMGALTRQ